MDGRRPRTRFAPVTDPSLNAAALTSEIVAERAYVSRRAHALYRLEGNGRLDFLASCSLFEIHDSIAVVSSAHALVRAPGEHYVFGDGTKVHKLVGHSRYSAFAHLPEKGKDPFDLEVIVLEPEIASAVDRSVLVRTPDFESAQGRATDGLFLVTGYPASKQRVVQGALQIDATKHSLLLGSEDSRVPAGEPISTDAHLVLHYDQKQFFRNGGRVTSPSPRGLSGSGVWRVNTSLRVGDCRRLQFVGTVIERHKDSHKVLVATRVDVALMLLLGLKPELREFIPARVTSPL